MTVAGAAGVVLNVAVGNGFTAVVFVVSPLKAPLL